MPEKAKSKSRRSLKLWNDNAFILVPMRWCRKGHLWASHERFSYNSAFSIPMHTMHLYQRADEDYCLTLQERATQLFRPKEQYLLCLMVILHWQFIFCLLLYRRRRREILWIALEQLQIML